VPTAPATPRRRLQPADRRAEIVEAATRLIAERGYRGLTVQGVAEACDLTVAGVLHHMGTKDGSSSRFSSTGTWWTSRPRNS
jgi:AcrR family transcriptional regulator